MLVMTFVAKSLSSVPAGVVRIAAAGFNAVTSIPKALRNRREVLFLSELDDRCLKDMGILRSDIDGALASSWLRDPSSILADRASTAQVSAAHRREQAARRAEAYPIEIAPACPAQPVPRAA